MVAREGQQSDVGTMASVKSRPRRISWACRAGMTRSESQRWSSVRKITMFGEPGTGCDWASQGPLTVIAATQAKASRAPSGRRTENRPGARVITTPVVPASVHDRHRRSPGSAHPHPLDSIVTESGGHRPLREGQALPRGTAPAELGTPELTVVVIGYNDRANLPDAISSVLGQTLRHLEVVVVDDASTDGSAEV